MKQVLLPIRVRRLLSVGLGLLVCIVMLPTTANAYMSSIGSNFNGTAIAGTSYIWFNSHLKLLSDLSVPVKIYVTDQTVTFTANSTNYSLAVPDATITIFPTSTAATTTYNTTTGSWATVADKSDGDPFMAGLAWDVPAAGLPGGISPVTWTANFNSSVIPVDVQWQWAAAVYTAFTDSYNAVGVLPIDGSGLQSGTPLNYMDYVTGGARGGGGSNYTGSNSGTASVAIPLPGAVLLGALGLGAAGLKLRKYV